MLKYGLLLAGLLSQAKVDFGSFRWAYLGQPPQKAMLRLTFWVSTEFVVWRNFFEKFQA